MFISGYNFGLQTAFCHNDLLSGNILLLHQVNGHVDGRKDMAREYPVDHSSNQTKEKQILQKRVENKSIRLIDYEYAGYNPRAWDLVGSAKLIVAPQLLTSIRMCVVFFSIV